MQPTKRAFMQGAMSSIVTLATPSIIKAQHLSRDIWTKQPQGVLKTSLNLLLDYSSSMKEEILDQRDGHIAAFDHPAIRAQIKTQDQDGAKGIACNIITFAHEPRIISPHSYRRSDPQAWAILETDDDIDQFRDFMMANVPRRQKQGGTYTIRALHKAVKAQRALAYTARRAVCDISTDGTADVYKTYGYAAAFFLRDTVNSMATKDNVTTNALTILGNEIRPTISVPNLNDERNARLDEYFRFYGVNSFEFATHIDPGQVFRVRKGGLFLETYTGILIQKLSLEIG